MPRPITEIRKEWRERIEPIIQAHHIDIAQVDILLQALSIGTHAKPRPISPSDDKLFPIFLFLYLQHNPFNAQQLLDLQLEVDEAWKLAASTDRPIASGVTKSAATNDVLALIGGITI